MDFLGPAIFGCDTVVVLCKLNVLCPLLGVSMDLLYSHANAFTYSI